MAMMKLISVVALAVAFTAPAIASGPFLDEAVFVSTIGRNPTDPTGFFEGRLGIVSRGLAPKFYVAAWRALAGKPFSKTQAQVLKLDPCCDSLNELSDAIADWRQARKLIKTAKPEGKQATPADDDPRIVAGGCSDDAFHVAAATLRQRIKEHGADDRWVAEWLAGQDIVFEDCHDAKKQLAQPDQAPTWLTKDRAYQIAAAHFYNDDFDRAVPDFRAIAIDADSPWRVVASYLVARSLYRAAQKDYRQSTTKIVALNDFAPARAQIEGVLADASLMPYHEAAQTLLRRILMRSNPKEAGRQLERQLIATDAVGYLAQDIADYDRSKAMEFYPMGKWILAMTTKEDIDSVATWRATPSLPWLVAAISSQTSDKQAIDEMIAASRQVDRASPAYTHLTYHRIRLLIQTERYDEARQELDALDFKAMDIPTSNQFLSLRMASARTVQDFVRAAPRRVFYFYNVGFEPDDVQTPPYKKSDLTDRGDLVWRQELYRPNPVYFDDDAASVFTDCLSLPALVGMVHQPWPAQLHNQLAIFAFARSVALQRYDIAASLANDLAQAVPQLQATITALREAQNADERRFLATLVLLRIPGSPIVFASGIGYLIHPFYIGDYGPWWWDKDDVSHYASNNDSEVQRQSYCKIPVISQTVFAAATAERKQLSRLTAAPALLGRVVLDYAARHPGDARLPEALHFVVRATRYGQPDATISRLAYNQLHKNFPGDGWTKQTPFWYGGDDN